MTTETNSVIRTTPLRYAPGWICREYADGTFVAAAQHSPAVSYPLYSFTEALRWAQAEVAGDDPQDTIAAMRVADNMKRC